MERETTDSGCKRFNLLNWSKQNDTLLSVHLTLFSSSPFVADCIALKIQWNGDIFTSSFYCSVNENKNISIKCECVRRSMNMFFPLFMWPTSMLYFILDVNNLSFGQIFAIVSIHAHELLEHDEIHSFSLNVNVIIYGKNGFYFNYKDSARRIELGQSLFFIYH